MAEMEDSITNQNVSIASLLKLLVNWQDGRIKKRQKGSIKIRRHMMFI